MPRPVEVVPAAPFSEWLNERLEYWEQRVKPSSSAKGSAVERLCYELGWIGGDAGARRLYRMRHSLGEGGKATGNRRSVHIDYFERKTVEDALFNAGVPFAVMYPEIADAEELELEPSGWCPGCREERHPINGICPFCEWRIGPETGQVLRGKRIGRRPKAVA